MPIYLFLIKYGIGGKGIRADNPEAGSLRILRLALMLRRLQIAILRLELQGLFEEKGHKKPVALWSTTG